MANKIFYTILALLIIGSIGATFYKIVIQKNYQIIAETSCDTETEKCYSYTDEETLEVSYYKIINKNAASIYACEQSEEKLGCDEELTCVEGEENCDYTYCDPDNVEEWEVCSVLQQEQE